MRCLEDTGGASIPREERAPWSFETTYKAESE